MRKTVILYGLILAFVAFGLTWIDYRVWRRDVGFEVYGLIIAALFGGLALALHRPKLWAKA